MFPFDFALLSLPEELISGAAGAVISALLGLVATVVIDNRKEVKNTGTAVEVMKNEIVNVNKRMETLEDLIIDLRKSR